MLRSSLVAVAGWALLLGGCQLGRTPDPLAARFADTSMTMSELDAETEGLTYRVQRSADLFACEAYRRATRSEERMAAAAFALRVTAELSRATYSGYPLATLVDLWVLNLQLQRYFEAAPDSYGGQGLELARAFAELASESRELAVRATGAGVAEPMATDVERWAAENPVNEQLVRPSLAPLLAQAGVKPERGLGEISETVGEGMQHLGEKIERLETQLPTVLTWQALGMVEARLAGLEGDLAGIMETIGASLEPIVAAQLERVITAVREERIAIMADVRRERVAIMEDVRKERLAIMSGVTDERVAILDDVTDQREALVASMDELVDRGFGRFDVQRVATIDNVQAMMAQVLAAVDTQRGLAVSEIDTVMLSTVDRAVDRLFWRAVVLGAGALVGLLFLVIVTRLLWRRA